jgi:glycine cleavage system H lipoate-binding protein
MSGTVVEHNPVLGAQPFLVNSDPEGAGWLLLVDPGSPAPPRAA